MYKINYYENAYKDIEEIVDYISNKLNNSIEAFKLKEKIIKSEKILAILPHIGNSYISLTGIEYYKYRVQNYYIIYCLDKSTKTINIVRVLYRKRNYQNLLS